MALLDAAEELLRARLLSDVTVQEIVDRADSSTGSFYARFDSKPALLDALQDRLHEAFESRGRAIPDHWKEGAVSPQVVAERYIDNMIADHIPNQGLIRALMAESPTNPAIIEKSVVLHRNMGEFAARYLDAPGKSMQEKADALATASTVGIGVLNQHMLYSPETTDNPQDPVDGVGTPADNQPNRDGLIGIFLVALDL